MTTPMHAVLTVEEATAVLRIGRTAAYEAARRGDLPTVRIGRALRVPRCQLDALLGVQNDERPVAATPGVVTTLAAGMGGDHEDTG